MTLMLIGVGILVGAIIGGYGTIWFIVGTASGFEGLTTLDYDAISVVLTPYE